MAMEAYDPLNAPDPDEWLSMDEHERINLVIEHHRQVSVELPNEQLHAVIHVVVENQIALSDEISTQATMERLMCEGLDRHDAIHAVGSVIVDFVREPLGDDDAVPSANERFCEELNKLTAAEWRKSLH